MLRLHASRAARLLSRRAARPIACVAGGRPLPLAVRPPHHPRRLMASVAARAATASDRPQLTPDAVPLRPDATPTVVVAAGDGAAASADLVLLALWDDAVVKQEGDGGDEARACAFSDPAAAAVDARVGGLLTDAARDASFAAAVASVAVVRAPRGGPAKHVGVLGLGPRDGAAGDAAWGVSPFARAAAAAAAAAKAARAETVAIVVCGGPGDAGAAAAAAGVARGVALGAYEATRFKKAAGPSPADDADAPPPPPPKTLRDVALYGLDADPAAAAAGVAKGAAVARGTLLARYLVEAPPNVCTPAHLARAAREVAAGSGGSVTVNVLGRAECEAMGMGCFLGVAACSAEDPQFIHLTFTPPGCDGGAVALVGKGLTFDSGGYNLKVGGMIEMMKFDMGGSAAVLGAADALAALAAGGGAAGGPAVHVIVAACENMIDGRGMRPGDVLTAADGTTVEVNNTDAEGRLTLADALWYAQHKAGATSIVDVATLTGACMVGLGTSIAAVLAADADAAPVLAAARAAGEKVWRLPLEEGYADALKSACADMKNSGGRYGGTITAGLFLKRFIKKGVAWAHLDIAGPAWEDAAGGATGFGVGTLVEWVLAQGKK